MKSAHLFRHETFSHFPWFSSFQICSMGKKTKIRKRQKLTKMFLKERILSANFCKYNKTLKKQNIWYASTIFASEMDKTTLNVQFWFFISKFER